MRALFIIHCQDPIYGASRSISALIRNLDAEVDIVFPIKIKKKGRITSEQIKKYYGTHVCNVWYLPQPMRLSVLIDSADHNIVGYIKRAIKDLLYFLCIPKYRRIFEHGQYDFIHLNSVVLYPMLCNKYPMFLHVRETVRTKMKFFDQRFTTCMEKAHGILFIVPSVRNACPDFGTPTKILVNPFDQRQVEFVDEKAALKRFGLRGTETVYSILGNVIPEKGVMFIIKAFQKAKLKDAILLIAGQDPRHRKYEREVQKVADNDPTIRFVGELEDTSSLYRTIDYVVRGDSVTGGGRTTYEGLYSGCGAIVPYQIEDDKKFFNLTEDMQNRLIFYKLRNEEDLIHAFQNTQFHKIIERKYSSNIEQYTTSFLEFVNTNNKKTTS